MYNSALWVNYSLNVEEITELFCENTDFPELKCNGKCHLKKQMASLPNPEQTPTLTINYLPLLELYFETPNDNPITTNSNVFNSTFLYIAPLSSANCLDIFHPPQA